MAQVSVIGGEVKEYQIQIDPERMRHYGVTLADVLAATRGMNLNANGGVIYEHSYEYIVRGLVSTDKVAQIGKAVVGRPQTSGAGSSPAPVLLEDIAHVHIGAQTPKLGTASERGKPACCLPSPNRPATSTLELTHKLEAALADLQKNLPTDVHVSTDIFRQSRFIESSIGNVKKSLVEGGLFVVIVLFLFLANVRTTFISLVTLPLSLVMSLLALHYMGTQHQHYESGRHGHCHRLAGRRCHRRRRECLPPSAREPGLTARATATHQRTGVPSPRAKYVCPS